ncbi:MAG TPA: hypothetical protein VF803_00795 [Candidatus Paceibacterota bacterium]
MLTIIIGGTPDERLKARRKAVGDTALDEIEKDRIDESMLATLAGTSALFGGAQAYLLRNVFGSSKAAAEEEGQEGEEETPKADLMEIISGLVESPHIFVVEEEKVLASKVTKLTKAGATIVSFEKAAPKKEAFNVFALADAMASADRKKFWLLLMQAQRLGIAPENIAGVLAWKARTALAGARSVSERSRWNALSRGLVVMYHDSHRGAGDLNLLLEKFALEM